MDYYKLRSRVFQEIKDYLQRCEELTEKGMEPPQFSAFQLRLISEYGATEKMIRQMIERLVPKATVVDGNIVRKEA